MKDMFRSSNIGNTWNDIWQQILLQLLYCPRPQSLLPSANKRATKLKNTKYDTKYKTDNTKYYKHLFMFPPERAIGRYHILKNRNTHLLSITACFNHQQPEANDGIRLLHTKNGIKGQLKSPHISSLILRFSGWM